MQVVEAEKSTENVEMEVGCCWVHLSAGSGGQFKYTI